MVAFASGGRAGACALGLFVCLVLAPGLAAGATCTWNGGLNGNWSNPPNWDNCGGAHALPMNGDSLVFPSGMHQVATVNDLVGLTLTGVQIMGPSLGGISYTITGNAVTFTAGAGLQFNAAPTQADAGPVFALPIMMDSALAIYNMGTSPARVDGSINLNGQTLTFNPSTADLFSTNSINGSGSITKIGARTVFLAGNSGFTGSLMVQSGTVRAETPGAFGSTTTSPVTTVAAGGTLALDSLIMTGVSRPLTLAGGTVAGLSGSNSWLGPVTLSANSFVSADPSASLTLSQISGNLALTKVGAGLVELAASFGFTGLTSVEAGTLIAGEIRNSNVSVVAGTLAGVQYPSIINTSAIGSLVASGGTVRPGFAGGSTGVMRVGGPVTLTSASTFSVALDGVTGPLGIVRK